MLHVVWSLPDLSYGATEAFQLNDVSVWSALILVKRSILGYMPMCYSSMLWASYHMLSYCHKHSSEKLSPVFYLQKCCQDSDAAQEALFDMTSQAGLQSGLVAGGVM